MSKKISVDLSDENFEALDNFKEAHQMPYSTTINLLLRILCKSADIKDELITICKTRIRAIYADMEQAGEFEYQKLFNKSCQYLNILSFLTQDSHISVTKVLDEKQMKKIRLADGYLTYPDDFILLNESAAQSYRYVCIVEVRNSKFAVPDFIYFSGNDTKHYTDNDISYIKQLCCQKWPRFQEIVETERHPIYDPENPLRCLNDEEMRISPQIGYFGIMATNDPNYSSLYAAPFNIKIIRDER